jgi:hypothetical protein
VFEYCECFHHRRLAHATEANVAVGVTFSDERLPADTATSMRMSALRAATTLSRGKAVQPTAPHHESEGPRFPLDVIQAGTSFVEEVL